MIRVASLALVVALLAPAIAGALCDVTCVGAHAHASRKAGEGSCHGHQPGSSGSGVKPAANQFCHNTSDGPDATLASAATQHVAQPAVLLETPAFADRQGVSFQVVDHSPPHPPDVLLTTTQLRI